MYAVRQEIGSPGGELSPKVTEGWFHMQSLIIRHAMRRPEGWPPYRVLTGKCAMIFMPVRGVEDAAPYK